MADGDGRLRTARDGFLNRVPEFESRQGYFPFHFITKGFLLILSASCHRQFVP